MLPWASLLVLALISGKFATTPKPVISLNPPWIPAIEGETVLLTCNGFDLHSPRRITWYHGNTNWTTTENTLKVHTAGEYRCQIQDSASSYPVHLQFSSAPLTLQAPVSVFQDDSVVLKCRAKENVVLNSLKIYKNTKILTVLNNSPEFHIHQASLKDNGEYFCKGDKESNKFVSSNSVKIEVEELFPLPVLTARPSQPTEGTLVTLTCEVQLPPQRLDIQLQFRFFRGRQALGSGWSHSPEFRIFNMRQTGSYSCNAKAVTLNRWKQSHEVQIRVQSEC
ncbi:Fc receptor-like protein 5 isoform X2 [Trichechus manatus latirostris]|uniref:Fc receptor-like protein 5 isoform X2 n=1 Tax=Trichechus manatus latirostris TaxID=127582 RepID=A0A2Y9QPT8_TRIMA|nr:Fc receptor-like protein 5 isoform X2 [Trichechus manatus latirostris]